MFSSFVFLLSLMGPAIGQQPWNYLRNGDDWEMLCRTGTRQSPINIETSDLQGYLGEVLNYYNYDREVPVRVEVDATHYTVKVTPLVNPKPAIYGGGLPGYYVLDSMHFHWPADHTVNGIRGIMEAHLVHRRIMYDNNTQASTDPLGIAVLGVLYVNTSSMNMPANPELNKIVNAAESGSPTTLNFFNILPYEKDTFYRYRGSLTTPNCAESVIWTVFSNPQYTTIFQVERFRRLLKENRFVNTYRNVQKLNGRTVFFWLGMTCSNNVGPI